MCLPLLCCGVYEIFVFNEITALSCVELSNIRFVLNTRKSFIISPFRTYFVPLLRGGR